jgi:hypothetical protein
MRQQPIVYQANNSSLSTQTLINRRCYDMDSYPGLLFSSSKIVHKKRWERAIKLHDDDDYTPDSWNAFKPILF